DVGNGILGEHDDVGEFARRDFADLPFEADGVGVVAGRGDDRLHRRVAAVLDEDLEFLGVQLAIGRERIVAGVGADQQLDAELARLCISSQSRSKWRFMRLMSSCICWALTVWPSSTTTARKVAVGMIGMPPLATASRSRSVARSA